MRHLISAIALCLFLISTGPAFAEENEGDMLAGPTFVEFEPFSVSVIQRTRIAGFLSVAFSLAVESEAALQQVERLRPKLNDAIVRILSRVASSRLDVSRPVDVDLVRTYVQAAVDSVIGKDKARVLMETVSLQPA